MKNNLQTCNPYFIAEIGINHNGIDELACLMTSLAISSGASAVKYQLFDPTELVSVEAEMADYQKKNSLIQESQRNMLEKNIISLDTLKKCRDLCVESDIDFICTAFDEPSLRTVLSLQPALLKWPSGEIDNLPLLNLAASSGLPIIISTGMADEEEISAAIETCLSAGLLPDQITILHCTSQYPTKDVDANIKSVRFLKDRFCLRTGFSDHTVGNLPAQLALAAGATVFEKHVSLSRMMNGVDHKASATFEEFADYINSIKHAKNILGVSQKLCFDVEINTKTIARKSLFARTNLINGTILEARHLKAMRPGTGISPKFTNEIIGKTLVKNIDSDKMLMWDDFK